MTKAKQIDEEGKSPPHCYFWIATITNNSVIPEYDFKGGIHRKARDLITKHIKMFSWYPITLDMMMKIKKEFGEDTILAIDDKVHSLAIDLEQGECLRTHPTWRNTINFMGGAGGFVKYAMFKTTKDGVKGYFVKENGEIEL